MRVEQPVSLCCPFGEWLVVDRPVRCPRRSDCSCEHELIRHVIGEVDAQTTVVVEFWMTRAPACGHPRRRMIPEFAQLIDGGDNLPYL